jgi:cytochrome c-type biogenesis protein
MSGLGAIVPPTVGAISFGVGSFLVAFAGGLVSFLSPCTLPLLPGYLAYISGLSVEEVQGGEKTGALMTAALLFVFGFSLVFVAAGAAASYIGSLVLTHHTVLVRIAGAFIIAMALFMMGVVRLPALYQEKRLHLAREFGVWSALPIGMAFGFGWTPCIGPVLASIFVLAAKEKTVQQGAFLLFIYSLGLGLPFLAVGLFADRALGSLGWFNRHFQAINLAGGSVQLVMGVFLVMNRWTVLLGPLMRWYAGLNLPT